MQIPRSYIESYGRALNELDARTKQALMRELETVDYDADPAAVRSYVSLIMQRYCGASATVAARLAADFYDGLRARFGIDDGYKALVDPGFEPMATDGAVRAVTQALVEGKPDEFKRKCIERAGYETRKAANTCVERNARRDPKKPRWARVPTGTETCRFCIMLASRGFVYHTEELASHSHDHCDCRVIPSWDGKRAAVEGYDPDYYLDVYGSPESHPEVAEAINARRRELRAQRKAERENTD